MMHVKGDPPDFPEGRFDSSLKAVILKALAVDPEKRFQSSEAFLEGLSAPHLIPVTASPISPTTRQKIGPRGISLIATLIVVLVLVLAFPIVKASFVPKDFDGLYQYAWDADEQGRIQDAEQAYRRCAQLQPMSAESWWGLGTTLEEQGRFAEAAQALQTASKLDTKSSDIAYALGYVLTADNQLKEGEKAIRRSIELAPKDADGYFALGSNLMKQGRDQEAIAALKKAVELNPNYKDVWSNLHFLYERHGDKAGAKEAQRHLK